MKNMKEKGKKKRERELYDKIIKEGPGVNHWCTQSKVTKKLIAENKIISI